MIYSDKGFADESNTIYRFNSIGFIRGQHNSIITMDWWKIDRETAQDIHTNLKQKEKTLPLFFGQSPQIMSRRYLVDWLAIIADSYDLCSTARHLAVLLLDYFMDKFDIEEQQLRIVALGCLLIACKLTGLIQISYIYNTEIVLFEYILILILSMNRCIHVI